MSTPQVLRKAWRQTI